MQSYGELLGPGGPLAAHIPDYAPRREQQAMADAVGEALENLETLLVEAGTGTGKTLAYLVPAVLCGRKVIISTGTRNLQDQLFNKDLPMMSRALGVPVKLALLKGRANYLCRHRLALEEEQARFEGQETDPDLTTVRKWARDTGSGDIGEVKNVPEGAAVWPKVTSTRDNCLGVECPEYTRCHVVAARRKAQQADIVIINHHLLLADLALKEEGFGELLPGADAVILDEAHQVPDTATQFFGVSLGSGQLIGLAKDVVAEALRIQSLQELERETDKLITEVREARLRFAVGTDRIDWSLRRHELEDMVASLISILDALLARLAELKELSKGMDNCHRRGIDFKERLEFLAGGDEAQGIRWLELRPRGFTLHLTPFDVAQNLRAFVEEGGRAWVFTSATLAVGDDFTHFASRMGLENARAVRLESPFDFRKNALLYLPEKMPLPSAPDVARHVIDKCLPVVQESDGGAFFLFTSHRALEEASRYLKSCELHPPRPVLVQGEAPRDELVKRFRELGNGLLLGTSSFWEGVDVRGQALSIVIIDKLPFASPGDPVLRARLEAIRQRGGNPFAEHQLPQAVIALKQGVGRLIRDDKDRGVVVICDPRITTKSYGQVFLAGLPSMPATQSLEEVISFLNAGRRSPRADCA